MRRFLALMLACCLVLSLVACGKGDKDAVVNTEKEQNITAAPTTAPTTAPTVAPTPTTAAEVSNGNLIPGGYFDKTNVKWGLYKESGGVGSIAVNSDKQMEVTISKTGTVKHAVQLYCDGFELLQNAEYELSFDISSTVDRHMEWRVQINGGDYHPYTSQESVALTKEMQHMDFTFTMTEASDPAPRLCFNLGFQESDGKLAAHKVLIDNVELFLKDDSKVTALATGDTGPSININQVGYRAGDSKIAIFRDSTLDKKFDVVNVKTGKTVYSGDVTGSVETASAGETVAYGDFSSVKDAGTYKLVATGSGESNEFVIADDVYNDIFADTVKMLYLQRCGSKLTKKYAGDFTHDACHTQKATLYGKKEKKDVSGGWHDAGDYGRYVVSGAKAVADLLLAYEDYGKECSDKIGIPESGNGVPDVLDEARYELEWMFKMQEKSGGVYHKVTGLKFEGVVMPEKDTNDLYIMPVSNCATGDFAAVMAMAARVYKSYDAAFAKKCLAASKRALSYMESNNNNVGYKNPNEVSTGEYPDAKDADEHFWAVCELYKTTGDSSYQDKLSSVDMTILDNGLGWQAVDMYGCYAYLTSAKQKADLKKKIQDKFSEYLSTVQDNIKNDGYFSSVGEIYPWGSNMTLANNGMLLLMADKILSKDESFNKQAKEQLDYLLGANATSYCFVTGYGTLSPQSTHHRPSQSLKTTMKGMLVGGADSNLEDPYAQNVLADKPAAKCYADNSQSYSCNEVTVYWNSPLVYLLAGLKSKE